MVSKIPRVSVGVPVYNGAAYLPCALESLLTQSFADFELIISDNASTDDTEAICRDYAERDSRIRYHRATTNVGYAGNFNRVFHYARGEYFKWAASDDICLPTHLQRCVEVLDRDPGVAWCHSRSTHIGSNGDVIDDAELMDVSYVRSSPNRAAALPHERFQSVLLGNGGCLDSYGLFRAELMRETQLILPVFGSEKVFIAELALRGRYEEIPERLFFDRIHPDAAGSQVSAADQHKQVSQAGTPRMQRLRLLRGYVTAVRRSSLPLRERAPCYVALGRYLLQVNKWKNVLIKSLNGTGLGGDNFRRVRERRQLAP